MLINTVPHIGPPRALQTGPDLEQRHVGTKSEGTFGQVKGWAEGSMRDEKGCEVRQGLMALSEGEAAPPPASSLVPVA